MNATAPSSEGVLATHGDLRPLLMAALLIAIVTFIIRAIQYRISFQGLPGPPRSLLLGTIPVMAEALKDCPSDAHPHIMMSVLHRKFNLGPIFFLDNWPLSKDRLMLIVDPVIANQVTTTRSMPKHSSLRKFMQHLVGPRSMLLAEGPAWKAMRSMFNPGFSSGHLMTLVGGIVDDALVFCDLLAEHARRKDIFQLEEAATRLTVDIIGRVVLDIELNSQKSENELVMAFRNASKWTPKSSEMNPFANLNPLRPIMNRYYEKKMDRYLERVLDERYALREGKREAGSRKPAIDLALDEYAAQQQDGGKSGEVRGTDKDFKLTAIDQMKTFIFAGHDTTSSTICYIYHLLNLHPNTLAKVRAEHDDVFGNDTSLAANLIKGKPHLLNMLPYTLATIKETLRLFPPASSLRKGDADKMVTHDGKAYPTKDFMIWVINHTISRRADLFPSPDEFIVERFLPAPDNFQEVVKDSWRPFEKGPRNCIGQELAIMETKVIMVLTLRDFDVSAAFEEWDRKLGREKPGETLNGRRGVFGYRAYQTLVASAKPTEGMPAKVRMRASS